MQQIFKASTKVTAAKLQVAFAVVGLQKCLGFSAFKTLPNLGQLGLLQYIYIYIYIKTTLKATFRTVTLKAFCPDFLHVVLFKLLFTCENRRAPLLSKL